MLDNIILCGNPNVGKTTIFNTLTNSDETISNFEGATVIQKSAELKNNAGILIDMPGVNGLSATGRLEQIVLTEILKKENSTIIDVIDLTNFKKNFYLLIDILESKKPVNVIFNMDDLLEEKINIEKLSSKIPSNFFISNRDKSNLQIDELLSSKKNDFKLNYGKEFEDAIEELEKLITANGIDKRFLAIQYIKGAEQIKAYISDENSADKIIEKLTSELNTRYDASSIAGYIFRVRQRFINELIQEVLPTTKVTYELKWLNEKFDQIALHKFWGYVTFAIIMYTIFLLTFNGIIPIVGNIVISILSLVGVDVSDSVTTAINTPIFETLMGYVSNGTREFLEAINTPSFIEAFIVDGVISGVGGVVVFLPQILTMFALLTILEGIGYFSRVNVLFENLFSKLGMSSTSLIPLISGLGCNVIGIMATRNIKSAPKRIATIFASPFMSCSARLPVYIIYINIFFENNKALVLSFLYFLGIAVAICVTYVIDKIVYKDTIEINVHTLPRYKKISLSYLWTMVLKKIKNFVNNAGKYILIGSIVIWLFSNFSFSNGFSTNAEQSLIYNLSEKVDFIFAPLGFGNPQAVASFVAAFLAKELAISAMIIMYGVDANGLSAVLANVYTSASALSLMVFTLLYVPCLATVGVIYSETKKKSYVFYSIALSLGVGYILSFIVYHIALLF